MRDRLIKILKQTNFDYCEECFFASEDGYKCAPDFSEFFADRLLENGVIVVPCKIGDTVYIIDECGDGECAEDYVLDVKVLQFFINEHGIAVDLALPLGMKLNTWMVVGDNVFLTKEEAEKALAKMKGGAE